MNLNSCAIAIFVKTPGLSPIKTRLAQTIGDKRASDFYQLSVAAIEELIQHASSTLNITPFWAVAEREGLDSPLWKHFDRIYQGEGELGNRLDTVYQHLKNIFSKVILIGVDCPQMKVGDFSETLDKLNRAPFVMGKSLDGGFYLFGGNSYIPSDVWNTVPYSVNETANRLEEKLSAYGKIDSLPIKFDIDTEKDLTLLATQSLNDLLLSQQKVVLWAQQWT